MKTLLANLRARFCSPEQQRGLRLRVKLGQDKALRKRNLSGPSLRVEKSTLPEGLGLSRAFREPFARDRVDPFSTCHQCEKLRGFGGRAPFPSQPQTTPKTTRISSLAASSNSDIHAEPVQSPSQEQASDIQQLVPKSFGEFNFIFS